MHAVCTKYSTYLSAIFESGRPVEDLTEPTNDVSLFQTHDYGLLGETVAAVRQSSAVDTRAVKNWGGRGRGEGGDARDETQKEKWVGDDGTHHNDNGIM